MNKIKLVIIYMSITGDIYNIDQSLTGDGITNLELNSLIVDGTFQNVNASFFNNITSPIQDQFDAIADIVDNNASLDFAFLNNNNTFTGTLNTFNSIQGNINNQSFISDTPAYYLGGINSNLQQQILALQPTGNPINGQSATISVGTTTTLPAGSNATVVNVGTDLDGLFNFGIPRGLQGLPGNDGITPIVSVNPVVDNLVSGSTPYVILTTDTLDPNNKILKFGLVRGSQGIPGNDGITPTFSIGTVTDLNAGSTPTVTITNDTRIDANGNLLYPNNKVISFSLVKGSKGDKGEEGAKGDKGEQGKQGDKGDTGSGADATSIAGLVLGGAGLVVSIGTLLGLFTGLLGNGLATGVEGAVVGTLVERVIVLEQKTTGLTYNLGTGRSKFSQTLEVGDLLGPTVRLSVFEESTFYYGLSVPIVGLPIVGGIVSAVSLNKAFPSAFNLGIITTGITAGAIGCASVTIISPLGGGFFDVTGISNFLGDVDVEGILTIIGDTNIEGIVTIEGETNITGAVTVEGETNFAGAVTIEGDITATGDIISIGTSISSQTYLQGINIQIGCSSSVISGSTPTIEIGKVNNSTIDLHGEVNIATDETNPLSQINIGNGTNDINIKSDIIQTGTTTTTLKSTTINGNIVQAYTPTNGELPYTTTLLDTSVKKLTLEDGDITQTIGTTTLFDLTVTHDVNLNGQTINIGNNFENNVIDIGNSQTTMSLEGETINIGIGTLANTINIGNSLTTLTLRSLTNNPINVDNAFNQFQEEFNTELEQLINEFNFLY